MLRKLYLTQLRQISITNGLALFMAIASINPTLAHDRAIHLTNRRKVNLNTNTKILYPITGQVFDDTGAPLPGATIVLKGSSSVGTTTNGEGRFTLNVPENSAPVLIISSIGYATQEVAVNNRTTLEIRLLVDAKSLGEVVVIGYGTQKKADLTGSVAVIDVKELNQQPTAQITDQLQGRASGVTVQTSGQPGQAPQVRIRGINTFGNNTPLYVVDGVPTTTINDLNPNDIASMQVLKDAGAASIYGARAANGVIILTTKRGSKNEKVKVSYDAYYGTQRVKQGNVWNTLSPQEMANLKWVALKNTNPGEPINDAQYGSGATPVLPNYIAPAGAQTVDEALYTVDPNYSDPDDVNNFYRIVKANKEGTDWYHAIFKPAPITSHNISVTGGSDRGNYLFSLNYFNQQGTLIDTYLKRYTIRSNSQYNVNSHIRLGENLAYSVTDNPQVSINDPGGTIGMAYRAQPIIPVYDIRGNYAGGYGPGLGDAFNPVAMQARTLNNRGLSNRLFGNVFAEVDFLKHVTARTSFGGEIASSSYHSFSYPQYENSENSKTNSYSENATSSNNWTWTNTLTYRNTVKNAHNITVVVGTEAYKNRYREVGGTTLGFFSFDPNYVNLSTGSGTKNNYSDMNQDALFSYLGRLDYNFKERYLLGVTLRRDGSSRFLNYQYGWFPAVSAGWRVSEESFMKGISWIDDLKIRGGYGIMGNQLNVDPANAFTTYASSRVSSYYPITGSNSTITEGFERSRIGNPDAKWEKNINTNIGIDASLVKGKLQLTVDYYRKDIRDLLYNPERTGTSGQGQVPFINIAHMKNEGVDLSATTDIDVTRDLKLNATLTFTTYNNRILNISNNTPYFDEQSLNFNGSYVIRNAVGQPLSQFFGYQVAGFWNSQEEINTANAQVQQTAGDPNAVYQTDVAVGRFRYADTNGDGRITDDDRTFLGNPNPKFSYGLNLGATYKGFDFSMFLYGVSGNKIWNNLKWWHDFSSSFYSAKSHTALYDSWTPDHHDAKAPIQETVGSFSTASVPNSYFVENGGYLRARNVQLGYTLPANTLQKLGVGRLRVYVQAANLFTITKYSGLDPELTGNTTSFGIDTGAYPNQRQYLFGINLSF
ncbi:SusC/RagA family TonB-linked outer membrane protein [Spirosoma radiotolerans]|uniref:SusC/RagA family TonB-linked outer membrane protein n=1 Tax=Spirosoma radiotolerans TaxID=1379870 RepID=UPI0009E589D6|nr:TonB-dependent receptor [Spirosoma radiotolerans]